jgi:hypothetical protein
MVEKKIEDIIGIGEVEFISDQYAKYKTLVEQDKKAWELTKGDVRETFRVIGIEPEDEENAKLRIITAGKEGEEKAREILGALKKYKRVSVVNDNVRRYDKEDEEIAKRVMNFWLSHYLETGDPKALEKRIRGE